MTFPGDSEFCHVGNLNHTPSILNNATEHFLLMITTSFNVYGNEVCIAPVNEAACCLRERIPDYIIGTSSLCTQLVDGEEGD